MDLQTKVYILILGICISVSFAELMPSSASWLINKCQPKSFSSTMFPIPLFLIFLADLKDNWLGVSIITIAYVTFFLTLTAAIYQMHLLKQKK